MRVAVAPAAAVAGDDVLARLERSGRAELLALKARQPRAETAHDPLASVIDWDLACV